MSVTQRNLNPHFETFAIATSKMRQIPLPQVALKDLYYQFSFGEGEAMTFLNKRLSIEMDDRYYVGVTDNERGLRDLEDHEILAIDPPKDVDNFEAADYIWRRIMERFGELMGLHTDEERQLLKIMLRADVHPNVDSLKRNGCCVTFSLYGVCNVEVEIGYFDPAGSRIEFQRPLTLNRDEVIASVKAVTAAAEIISGKDLLANG